MPSKLKKAIGAVKDHTSISLVKVANGATGGGDLTTLEVSILKATSHDEEVPIDDRLVTEILGIISSKKSHAAACAAAIGRRIGRTRNWIVALKSLVLVLRIFQDGDPYFPREVLHAMKRGAKILNLSNFRDDSNSCPWDFTAFLRTFALYLDERLDCFLTGKLQRRYTNQDQTGRISTASSRSRFNPKNGIKSHEPAVRDMKPVMLLDKITYWQRLLDRAMATRPTGDAKSNKLVKVSLYAVTQESFDLYRDISDGLALLLDSFFHLQYQSCIQAFQACVRASKQFQELNGFYDLCKSIGIGRTSEYPSIQNISLELLETLQEFLKDQSSFPASAGIYPSPNSLLLPPPPSSKGYVVSSSLDFGDSTIDTSERYSDYGSFRSTSLEDLMSRTEAGTPMSSHSEPYGGGRDGARSRDDLSGNNFDTVSTKSLPNIPSVFASNFTLDLVPFDDVDNTAQAKDVEDKKPDDSNSETFDPWEALMLRDGPKRKIETMPEEPSNSDDQRHSGNWLLALEETATQVQDTNSMAIIPFGLDDPLPAFQTTMDLYNPFLVEPPDPLAIAGAAAEPMTTFNALAVTEIQPEPTFQVKVPDDFVPSSTPTFKATGGLLVKSDPLATFENLEFGQTFSENGGVHQQYVSHEQQLWLQNQNKIIAKHLNSYNG